MKKFIFLFLIALSSCKEKEPTPVCSDSTKYTYDEKTGTCKNCLGAQGFNVVDLDKIKKSKNAECIYLNKKEILLLMGDSSEIPGRLSYQSLRNYNFNGSVLDSCQLSFTNIYEAQLKGTNLSTLQYGYAFITGIKDNFTIAPIQGKVIIDGDSIRCSN